MIVRLGILGMLAAALLGVGCQSYGPDVAPGATAAVPVAPTPDHDRYRAAARRINGFDTGGVITRIRWSDDGATLTFTRLGERHSFDLANVRQIDDVPAADEPSARQEGPGADRPRRPRIGRGRQRDRERSPDGVWEAVCHDWNVVLERVTPGKIIQFFRVWFCQCHV